MKNVAIALLVICFLVGVVMLVRNSLTDKTEDSYLSKLPLEASENVKRLHREFFVNCISQQNRTLKPDDRSLAEINEEAKDILSEHGLSRLLIDWRCKNVPHEENILFK